MDDNIFSKELINLDHESVKMSPFIKLVDLLGKRVKIVKVDVVRANSPMFGAAPIDSLYKNGILKEGETIRYKFITSEGVEKNFETKSVCFYWAIRNANLRPDDIFIINRTGSGKTTKYSIIKE